MQVAQFANFETQSMHVFVAVSGKVLDGHDEELTQLYAASK
jgi:hypothetical protein